MYISGTSFYLDFTIEEQSQINNVKKKTKDFLIGNYFLFSEERKKTAMKNSVKFEIGMKHLDIVLFFLLNFWWVKTMNINNELFHVDCLFYSTDIAITNEYPYKLFD